MTKKKILGICVIIVLFIGLASATTYFYWQYTLEIQKNPTRELADLTKKVGKLILLPESSVPTLATVTEKEKLQSQNFFKKAENGDKVLIFMSEGKAILYRPTINKIIEVAPITSTQIESNSPAPTTPAQNTQNTQISQQEEQEEKKITITLYNGTTTTGITSNAEKLLTDISFPFEVIDKQIAQITEYSDTLVVDITGTHTSQAKEIAKKLGAIVGELPTEEIKPESDILVIVGNSITK